MKKAVIMAGGFGTRLRPLSMNIPKPMVPILNTPMLEHIINLLKKHGINNVVSVLYFQPDIIRNYFTDGSNFDIDMKYVLAVADYGTAGAVKNAYEHLNERFIVISGDVLTDFNLSQALEFHLNRKSLATILLTRVHLPLQYGIVMTDKEGRITRFLEKPSWGQVFSDTINTGIYILEPGALDLIPYREEFDFSKDLFPLMLRKKLPLYGFITEGYWRDIGNLREYQHGQMDALSRKVNLELSSLNKNIILGSNVNIASTARLEGNILIGENSTVGEHSEIKNSVIGKNVKIGNGVKILGTTIWDDTEIGDFSELTNDVVCNKTKIGRNVYIHENVFIAEGCWIQNSATLLSNIKLWPFKHVEEGSTLSNSLVQEARWLRELFTDARISGVSNIDLHPEFGAKLGAAIGMAFGKNSTLIASRDPDRVSRILKRAITSGISSVGVNVNDLQTTSIPQTRQELRTSRYEGGFHVRRSPRIPNETDIIIFNFDGRDISISRAKNIERYFFGEDIKHVPAEDVGDLNYPERTNEIYINRYLESLDTDIIKNRKFKILLDYSFGLSSTILPQILGMLTTEVLSLNNYVDASRFRPLPDIDKNIDDEAEKIMRSLGYELGFRIEPGAEKISLIDERGQWYAPYRLLDIILKLFLETNRHREPYNVAISVVAGSEIEQIAKEYNIEVIRIKNSHYAMMEAAKPNNILFVGGIYGGYVFSDFLFASDGMFSIGKTLEMLAKTNMKISQLDSQLPKRIQHFSEITCPWEFKGKVMRRAMEYSEKYERQLVEGVKIFENNCSVLLFPAKEKGAFAVIGESDNFNEAVKISEKYISLVKSWRDVAE